MLEISIIFLILWILFNTFAHNLGDISRYVSKISYAQFFCFKAEIRILHSEWITLSF